MRKYILDANLFFNMEAGLNFGKKAKEVIQKMAKVIKKISNDKKAEFYMPPRIVSELLSFFENKDSQFLKSFLALMIVKSPDYNRINFSAMVFMRLIADIRERSYRGLKISEEEMVTLARKMASFKKENEKDFQIEVGQFIKKLRKRYRNATRHGFIDSVADLDIIVLAKEIDGTIVSTDEGVLSWGKIFGVRESLPDVWKEELNFL